MSVAGALIFADSFILESANWYFLFYSIKTPNFKKSLSLS